MTKLEQEALIARLNEAWNSLSIEEQDRIRPMLAQVKAQKLMSLTTGQVEKDPNIPHHMLLIESFLNEDHDRLVKTLHAPIMAPAIQRVGPEGEIWGFGKYQEMDLGWLEAGVIWLENLRYKYPFPNQNPPVINIPDDVTIAMMGDWGTGNWRGDANPSPSAKVAEAISNIAPDVIIHLGDVYYSGTNKQESENLLADWPSTKAGGMSFTLNSNHEMYPGAAPLFQVTLAHEIFAAQQKHSFFALENSDWVIICLDSAYYSNVWKMYMSGALGTAGNAQFSFIKTQAAKGKKTMVVTHHNGISDNPNGIPTTNAFWNEMMSAFPVASPPAYWYWGHVHTGVVYKDAANGTKPRCLGHGAIPWGFSSELDKAKQKGNILWFENRNANDPDIPVRVYNGFTILELSGSSIKETFYDETGNVAWAAPDA